MKLRVRELREERGLTVQELADRAGLSKSYLSEIERGVKTVNARRLEQLASALRVRPTDLIADKRLSADLEEHLALLAQLGPEDLAEVLSYARFRAAKGSGGE